MRGSPVLRRALRAVDGRVVAALPPKQRRQWLYLRVHRRPGSFENPSRFTEKVNWRILNDRRPELAWTCDKLQMKDHAAASGAPVRVPATLWSGTDVRSLADEELPARWVLKPTHRSGLVHFGDRGTDYDELAVKTRDWLTGVEGGLLAEWAYAQARPLLFVEEALGEPGSPPPDYKFFVFHGTPRVIQLDVDRFGGHRRSLVTPEWELLDVRLNSYPSAGLPPRPQLLPEMLDAARALGADFDFIRIDLYAVDGEVVFGEYTPYPGSGLERFDPDAFDLELGGRWSLPQGVGA